MAGKRHSDLVFLLEQYSPHSAIEVEKISNIFFQKYLESDPLPGLPPHEVEKAESSSKNAEESGSKN